MSHSPSISTSMLSTPSMPSQKHRQDPLSRKHPLQRFGTNESANAAADFYNTERKDCEADIRDLQGLAANLPQKIPGTVRLARTLSAALSNDCGRGDVPGLKKVLDEVMDRTIENMFLLDYEYYSQHKDSMQPDRRSRWCFELATALARVGVNIPPPPPESDYDAVALWWMANRSLVSRGQRRIKDKGVEAVVRDVMFEVDTGASLETALASVPLGERGLIFKVAVILTLLDNDSDDGASNWALVDSDSDG